MVEFYAIDQTANAMRFSFIVFTSFWFFLVFVFLFCLINSIEFCFVVAFSLLFFDYYKSLCTASNTQLTYDKTVKLTTKGNHKKWLHKLNKGKKLHTLNLVQLIIKIDRWNIGFLMKTAVKKMKRSTYGSQYLDWNGTNFQQKLLLSTNHLWFKLN